MLNLGSKCPVTLISYNSCVFAFLGSHCHLKIEDTFTMELTGRIFVWLVCPPHSLWKINSLAWQLQRRSACPPSLPDKKYRQKCVEKERALTLLLTCPFLQHQGWESQSSFVLRSSWLVSVKSLCNSAINRYAEQFWKYRTRHLREGSSKSDTIRGILFTDKRMVGRGAAAQPRSLKRALIYLAQRWWQGNCVCSRYWSESGRDRKMNKWLEHMLYKERLRELG